MSTSSVTYTGDGSLLSYSVPFPFILATHVQVFVDNAIQATPANYVWSSPSAIQFTAASAPRNGARIYIRRVTPLDTRLVTFIDGASLTEADLNLNTNQLLYGVQEVIDAFNAIIAGTYTDPSNELLANAASAVLTTEAALEVQARITDIDHAGQLLLEAMMQRRVLGEPNDDYSAFKLATGTITLDETGITLLHKFATITTDTTLLAQDIALLGARNGAGTAFVLDVTTVQLDAGTHETMASRFSTMAAATASNLAAISSEATARANADTAIASTVTALTATVGTNTAAIATEVSARASGDSANASSITALTTTVSGHTSSLTTLAATDVTLAGGITTLNARYGVALNVDGFVSGFALNSTGTASSFDILTNKFRVVDPGPGAGATPVSVFTISGGNVYLQNLFIDGSLMVANSITAGKLSVSTLSAITASIGALTINSTGSVSVGKANANDTTLGIWLGTDGSSGYDFHIGDATTYLHFDYSAQDLLLSPNIVLRSLAGPFPTNMAVTVGTSAPFFGYWVGAGPYGALTPIKFIDGRLGLQTVVEMRWTSGASNVVEIRIAGTAIPNDDRSFTSIKIGSQTTLLRSTAGFALDGLGNTAWTWSGINTTGYPTSGGVNLLVIAAGLS